MDESKLFKIISEYQRKHKLPQICMCPPNLSSCSSQIIGAHTVQKSNNLTKVAKDSHVYYFEPNFFSLVQNSGFYSEKLIGINEASTFFGFCNKHDTDIFREIEVNPWTVSQRTTALHGFRAACNELYKKIDLLSFFQEVYTKFLTVAESIDEKRSINHSKNLQIAGTKKGIRHLENIKSGFDKMILNDDYNDSNYVVIHIDKNSQILVCGAMMPEFTFDGKPLQRMTPQSVNESVSFSICCNDQEGAIIFNWIGNQPMLVKFIASFLSLEEKKMGDALIRYCFESYENLYISPNWWDNNLSDNLRGELRNRTMCMPALHSGLCLKDDGLHFVNWGIKGIQTNISF